MKTIKKLFRLTTDYASRTTFGIVAALQASGATFRNEIISGPGGRQILANDPDGNPSELFESNYLVPRQKNRVPLPQRGQILQPRATPEGEVQTQAKR